MTTILLINFYMYYRVYMAKKKMHKTPHKCYQSTHTVVTTPDIPKVGIFSKSNSFRTLAHSNISRLI